MIRIGYLGPRGTFSEVAAREFMGRKGMAATLVEGSTIDSIFGMLDGSEYCDYVIVPVENSLEGPVITTQDMLIQSDAIPIEQEFSIPIVHHLLVRPGTNWKDVIEVVSHPQPIGQCRHFLKTAFSAPPRVQFADSTSQAAKIVASGEFSGLAKLLGKNVAVIGSELLADIYDLEIAQRSIQDSDNNRTRFWVLSKQKRPPSGHDKTTLIFSTLKDRPGGLYEVLGEFAKQNINLTSISSRPTKNVLGEYLFFIDFLGHQDEKTVKMVLEAVQKRTSFFKLVGSYRREGEE